MPKLSFIVPVYKVENYIKQCIETLIAQSESDIEIILIDDGSPDNSGRICDEYAMKDMRIRVIHQENSGVSVARNNGLDIARGEWVTFVDGDDYVSPILAEELLKALQEIDIEVVFYSYYMVKNNSITESKLIQLPGGDISDKREYIQKKIITQYYDHNTSMTGPSPGTCWGKVIRKSLLDELHIRFKPGLIRAQDTVFWLNILERVEHIYLLDECLYYYRVSETNVTSGTRYIVDSEQRFGMLLREYQSFIENNGKDVEYVKAFRIRTLQVLLWNMDHNLFHPCNPNSLREKLSSLRNLCSKTVYASALQNRYYTYLPKASRVKIYLCKCHLFLTCYIVFKGMKLIKSKIR